MDPAKTETTRYLAASALLLGSSFRRQVLDFVRRRPRALAPELGLDLGFVVRVCRFAERKETFYQALLAGLSLFLLLAFASLACRGSPERAFAEGAVSLLLLAWIVQLVKRHLDIGPFLRRFKREAYDPVALRAELREAIGHDTDQLPLPNEQNVIVYRNFVPFVGSGAALGGDWSVTVNVGRPKEHLGIQEEIQPFEVPELYEEVDAAVGGLGLPGLSVRDVIFVSGADARKERWLLPDIYGRPLHRLDRRLIQRLTGVLGRSMRHYKWIEVQDWAGELIVSYFLRLSRPGEHLFIEVNRFLLTPVAERFRAIDALQSERWTREASRALLEFVAAPFAVLESWGALCGKLMSELGRWMGLRERRARREVDDDPQYNYGASTSLREAFSGDRYRHYFQRTDQEMYLGLVGKKLLDTLVDFLDRRGIDTSDLKDRQTAILNQGIIVQRGSVQAEVLAVGAAARAQKKESWKKAA